MNVGSLASSSSLVHFFLNARGSGSSLLPIIASSSQLMLCCIQRIFLEVCHVGVRSGCHRMTWYVDLRLSRSGRVICATRENVQVVIEGRFIIGILNDAGLIDLLRSLRRIQMVRLLVILCSSWISRHGVVPEILSWFVVNGRSCILCLTLTHGHRVSLQVVLHVFRLGRQLVELS